MQATDESGLIHIDGRPVPFRAHQTVLQAALAAGLNIPYLCYHPALEAIGSCRVCLVEADGRTLSACTLRATAGQQVLSDTPRLRQRRMAVTTLLLEQGSHTCTRCERTSDCRLQTVAAGLGVPAVTPRTTQPMPLRDDSHPQVILDRGRCILCGICVQASRTLDGKAVFGFGGSGAETGLLVNSASGLLQDSQVAPEDQAVRLCPVGALFVVSPAANSEFGMFEDFSLPLFDGGFAQD